MTDNLPCSFEKRILWILRIAASMCFVGHGAFGFITKESWIPFFSFFGIPRELAFTLMPVIGSVDVVSGILVLIVPIRVVLIYMFVWATWTAALRPIVGLGVSEFFERAGNFGVPLALLIWDRQKSLFGACRFSSLDNQQRLKLITVLQVTLALILWGHGAFYLFLHKGLLTFHLGSLGIFDEHLLNLVLVAIGVLELVLGAFVLLFPSAAAVFVALVVKVTIELLYPLSGDYWWEFIERGGSYGSALALFFLLRISPQLSFAEMWHIRAVRLLNPGLSAHVCRNLVVFLAITSIAIFVGGYKAASPLSRDDHPLGIVAPLREKLISGSELIERLKQGGFVIYFRHFHTSASNPMEDPVQWRHGRVGEEAFDECLTQRQLSEYGIYRAEIVGKILKEINIPIGKVFSSPYCRCVESAKLITGQDPKRSLGLVFRRAEQTRERMENATHLLLSQVPVSGTNTVIVAHRPPMDVYGKIEEGEAFVFSVANSSKYSLIAKVKPNEWAESQIKPDFFGLEGAANYNRWRP